MASDDQYHCGCCNPFHRGHRNLGCGMIVSGVFLVAVQIAATVGGAYAYKLSAGVWAGALMIGTGGVAITYQNNKKKPLYVGYGVLTHVTAMACVIVLGASVAGTHADWTTMTCDYRFYRWRYRHAECYQRDFKLSMHVFLVVLGLVGIVLNATGAAIVWSQICCKAKEMVQETKAGMQDYKKVEPLMQHTETDV